VTVRFAAGNDNKSFLKENEELFKLLAGLSDLNTEDIQSGETFKHPEGAILLVGSRGFEVLVYIADAVDMNVLKQKFTKDLERDKRFIETLKSKLSNENFVKNAPAELVENEKNKLEDAQKRTEKLESYIKDIG
jgi:valyl-tRNA synthetase